MDNFKTFYNDKKGKYILFFGFYLIFFIVVSIYLRSVQNQKTKNTIQEKEQTKEVITTYDISNLIDNDYTYSITIQDNEEELNFKGSKSNIDYANYEHKYFLDIYNINQLLKRSTLVNSENNILTYELSNSEINDILLTSKEEDVNTINVYVSDKTEVTRIDLDLSKYLDKSVYQITMEYTIGENNEDSAS